MPSHERSITQIHYSLRREINELYWAIAIKNFATGLVGLFVPIYIFLYFDQSFPKLFLFYIAQFAGQILVAPLAAQLMNYVGVKKLMAIGAPFLGLYLVFLTLLPYGSYFLVLAVLAKVAYLTIFWPARHFDFTEFSKGKRRGRQIGVANIIVATAKTLAPFVGGFAIAAFGFTSVFIFAAVLFLFSSVPLFMSPEVHAQYKLSWWESYATVFTKKNRMTSLAFFFEGIEYTAGIFLFPVFIFLVIGNVETIGVVTSLSLVLALVFTYLIGWLSDTRGSRGVLSFASVAQGFAWVIVSFIVTPFQYFVYASFLKLTEVANHLPFMNLVYKHAKEHRRRAGEYIVFHEIAHNAGRIVLGLVVIFGFMAGMESFLFYFSVAGGAALLYRLMK
jgi:MFS family permease